MNVKKIFTIGVAVLAICALSVPAAFAQAVPGGTLDPTTVPKYVTPLIFPPVLFDDSNTESFEVSLREFSQQVLPTTGCLAAQALNPALVCTGLDGDAFPATPLWGYGDPALPGSVAEGGTFNNPSFTIEATRGANPTDIKTTVKWVNELVLDPVACRASADPANDPNCAFIPHIIQDQNGVPIIDQTLHWAAPNQDCLDGVPRTDCRGASDQPYTGPVPMVVHVHGAHVGPGSDGYPEAWWLPLASGIPTSYATNGTYFESADGNAAVGQGYAIDEYSNDQPTTTLWYHDHSLGITRLNVYATSAGFWLIRDANDGETGLLPTDALGNPQALPGPAPTINDAILDLNTPGNAVRNAVREIPIAIQPKSFNADGSQFYPADRAFFEGLGTGGIFKDNTGVNIPFLPAVSSDIAPAWNPEAFFNTMVVNGNTWPVLEVAPERYRLRFVNASDSRFLNLALFTLKKNGKLGDELPWYQIGSEQGLLPQVVMIETGFATPLTPGQALPKNPSQKVKGTFKQQALLMGPAERPDVIVDFTGLPDGTIVRMINTGPDAPFGGFPDVPADPATTGQVMQFVVNSALANPNGDPSTPPNQLVLDPNPGGDPKLGVSNATRDLALLEEESALICVTVDAKTGVINEVIGSTPPACALGGVPFAPKAAVLGVAGSAGGQVQLWDDPIAQNPQIGATETWELWNWSADAHPIHPHLVKFEVLDRQVIGGAVRPPEPWEAGWKDTVIAYPGEVTRVKANFDIPGLYVWHCHILSHEDNEMMVPYCVGQAGTDCPAELF